MMVPDKPPKALSIPLLIFIREPVLNGENPKLLFENQSKLYRFVPELVPKTSIMAPNGSRRALSIALLVSIRRPVLHGGNPKGLFENH
jgi:hypothetical protein